VATIVAMAVLSFYAYSKGNIHLLIGPLDGQRNICGGDAGYIDYPNLYLSKLDGDL